MELALAKGVSDLSPSEKIAQNKVLQVLESTFALYGFSPLDTPLLERYDVLASKYAGGAEILKEIFTLTDQGGRKLCLRYDLTVPFARYVGMHPQLKLPFKRYQIGKVYRDGPVALGRLREFTQCDCDVVGPKSALVDAELLALAQEAYTRLDLRVEIRVNDRQLLNGLMVIFSSRFLSSEERDSALLIIDKLDKIGSLGVADELASQHLFSVTQAQTFLVELEKFFVRARDVVSSLTVLAAFTRYLTAEATARKRDATLALAGLSDLRALFEALFTQGVTIARFSPSLVRGLAYYTGVVFEVYALEGTIASAIGSGGRYDAMIGNFLGGSIVYPACGISFGLDRIVLALGEKNAPATLTFVYVIPVGNTVADALALTSALRTSGISTEVDLVGKSPSKNLDYAAKLGIPYVVFVGAQELAAKAVKVRNMDSGVETLVPQRKLASEIKKLLKTL